MNDCCPACRARNYGELATLRAQLADLENQRKEWKRIAQNNIAANVEKEREIADLRSRINSQTDHLNDWIRVADKRLLEADELREENRRLMEINKKLGEQNEQVTHKFECLEKYANGDIFVLKQEKERLTKENQDFNIACEEMSKRHDAAVAEQSRLIVLVDKLERENAELESYRKLSGEYASIAKRDAIRDENKRLKQENQQHAQQIKSLQADLNEAIKKNLSFAYIEAERNGWKVSAEEHKAVANSLQQRLNDATKNIEAHEAAWCLNWQEKVRKLKGQITILEAARDHWQTESDNWRMKHNELFDDNKALKTIRDNWEKTAAQENQNYLWLRGILDTIGGLFGDAAKTDDTGAVTAGVFYSKLPALVEKHLRILGDTVSGASFRALQSKFFTLNKQVRDALDESIRQ